MGRRTLILREDTKVPWELDLLFMLSDTVEIPSGYSVAEYPDIQKELNSMYDFGYDMCTEDRDGMDDDIHNYIDERVEELTDKLEDALDDEKVLIEERLSELMKLKDLVYGEGIER